MNFIPFNKPYLTGKELVNIEKVLRSRELQGDGLFTHKCQKLFNDKFNFTKSFLTTSCTDAIEMASLLVDLHKGDEVIVPSYTFVSTANPFVLRDAKIIFADSYASHPNLNVDKLEELITPKTKAIVPVHYAGVACDMDKIVMLAKKYNLVIIEDAAHSIDSYYKNISLGSIGHMSSFSFHETKNIISGEGGMLVINDEKYIKRAEIIREKGTNRSQFFRGEIDKYGWVDIGSSFLPSELIAAFLYAQLENLDAIQKRRLEIWELYYERLKVLLGKYPDLLPYLPSYATNNAHMFYLNCNGINERTKLIEHLYKNNIKTVFHYISLHSSKFFTAHHDNRILAESDKWTDCLLRLPLYVELTDDEINFISDKIIQFYNA